MKTDIPHINLADYQYVLPKERIAQHPLPQRDHSKLLVYRQSNITHDRFYNLAQFLPPSAILFFNNTKVINARLFFQRPTGATIQLFLLEPLKPFPVQLALEATDSCTWQCMIGNKKKWKEKESLQLELPDHDLTLEASWENYTEAIVRFSWNRPEVSFAEIIDAAGNIPLPPYIERAPTDADLIQYQTIYSKEKGAVAAPTAGLHFTDKVFETLRQKGIQTDFVTLHVSAGTFRPIKTEKVQDHDMHSEDIIISKKTIENLLEKEGQVVAVGTTSMRVLESLYWLGVDLIKENAPILNFNVKKLAAYQLPASELPTYQEVFSALLKKMEAEQLHAIYGKTEIFIFPGYTFKVCKGLITNFHMPQSTLILLIAAFIGEDWRKVYQEALDEGYRFLSYGDSSLLMPNAIPSS